MTIEIGNLFESIPKEINQELFSELVSSNTVKIERIVSRGHSSPVSGWYDQAENEWVVVLKGAARIALENQKEVNLQTGDHLNIPAHTKHKVSWTSPNTETIWLAVSYS